MRGLLSILLLFRNEFNKFNKTGTRMLDSIYHMALKFVKNGVFGAKSQRNVKWRSLHNVTKSVNH